MKDAIYPKIRAADIPAALALNPPMNTPMNPYLSTASFTPCHRTFPNPRSGTPAPILQTPGMAYISRRTRARLPCIPAEPLPAPALVSSGPEGSEPPRRSIPLSQKLSHIPYLLTSRSAILFLCFSNAPARSRVRSPEHWRPH